jgi:hypothetical protein
METLSLLFGSALRVRMMRIFLFNPASAFDVEYIEGKTGAREKEIEKEAAFLRKLGLVKATTIAKTLIVKKGKKKLEKKMKAKAFVFDHRFKFAEALTDFMIKTHSVENRAIVRRIEKAGKIKAVVVSGIFNRNSDSRLDLFVVGDNIKSGTMDKVVRGIESDMGKDIRYAVLSAPDFAYRLSMNDKLVRDVLDFPHTILVDKIGLPAK